MPAFPVPDPPLSDGLISLRRMRLDDVDAVAAAVADPDVPKWTKVPQPYSPGHATEWISSHDDEFATGSTAPFALVDATSDTFLGSLGVVGVDWQDLVLEIGYWTTPAARGRGATTRGVQLLSRWAFEVLGMKRVELWVAAGNVASHRVAEKAGFRREATLRSRFAIRSDPPLRDDATIYGLLASELGELGELGGLPERV